MNFLFIIYFIGILIAVFQDFKRREIDDWLNLFLFFSGVLFLFFYNQIDIVSFGFFALFMLGVSFLLYYSRFFAGGDATLLFALTPLFYNIQFVDSVMGFSTFFIFLLFSGVVYSFIYISFFIYKDFRKIKVYLKKYAGFFYVKIFFLVSLIFLISSFFNILFLIIFFYINIFSFLFILAKSLEKVSLTKRISVTNLREGDWLSTDLKINGKTIYSSWEGLTKKEIEVIRRKFSYVEIKEGIPYAFAFLLALILYYFKDQILILF